MAEPNSSVKASGQKYVNFDEYVDFHLVKAQASIKTTEIITVLVGLGAGVLLYILTFVVLDQWVLAGGFSDTTRVILSSSVLLITLAVLGFKVFYPLVKRVHPLYAAKMLEQAEPTLKSNLLNLVDVREAHASGDATVLRAMEKRAAVELSHVDVDQAVDRRKLLHLSYVLLVAVLASCLYAVFSPKDLFTSMKRALFPTSPVAVPTQTRIADVTPGDTQVPARTRLTVKAEVQGQRPPKVTLYYTTADRKLLDESIEMRPVDEQSMQYQGIIQGENGRGLQQDITYRLEAGDYKTSDFHVSVIQPPSTRVEEIKYVYPAYTQLKEKIQTGVANIDAWEGTTVHIRAIASVPVKSARIRFTDTETTVGKTEDKEVALQIRNGVNLEGEWKLLFRNDGTAPRFYHLDIRTLAGEPDPEPTHYALRIRPDQRPEVTLLSPTSDLQKPANAIIPLVIQASDPDFQLRFLTLKIEKKGEVIEQRLFQDKVLGQVFRGTEDFSLQPLGLVKGDKLRFWVEAKDNRQPTANRTSTTQLTIEIVDPVSPEAVQRELAEDKQKARDELAANNPESKENKDDRSDPPSDPPTKPRDEKSTKPPQEKGKAPTDPKQAPEKGTTPETNDEEPGEDKQQGPADDQKALEKVVGQQLARSQEKPEEGQPPENPEQDPQQPSPEQEKEGPPPSADQKQPSQDQKQKSPQKGTGKKQTKPQQGTQEQPKEDKTQENEQNPKEAGKREGNQKTGRGKDGKQKGKPQPGNQQSGTKDPESPPEPQQNPTPGKNPSDGEQKQDGSSTGTEKTKGKTKPNPGKERSPKPGDDTGTEPPTGDEHPQKDPKQTRGKGKEPGTKPEPNDDNNSTNPKSKPGQKPNPGKEKHEPSSAGETPPPGENLKDPKTGEQNPQPGSDEKSPPQPGKTPGAPQPKEVGKEKPADDPNTKGDDKGTGTKQPMPPEKDPKQESPDSRGKGQDELGKAPDNEPKPGEKGPGEKGPGEKGPGNQPNSKMGKEKPEPGKQPDPGSEPGQGDEPGKEPGPQQRAPGSSPKPGEKPGQNRTPPDPKSGDPKSGDPKGGDPKENNPQEQPGQGPTDPKDHTPGKKPNPNRDPKPGTSPDQPQDQVATNDVKKERQPGRTPNKPQQEPRTTADSNEPANPETPPGTPKKASGKGADENEQVAPEIPKGKPKGTKPPTSEKDPADKTGTGDPQGPAKKGETETPPEGVKPPPDGDSEAPGKQDSPGPSKPGPSKPGPGKPGPGKPGPGEPSSIGQPSEKPGDGTTDSETKEAPGKPGGPTGKAAPSKSPSKGPGTPSPGTPGTAGEEDPKASHNGGGGTGDAKNPGEGNATSSPEESDPANLEYARKATDLVLKRLENELKRGEVDPALLKELGWTNERMAQFVKRMQEQLKDSGKDTSPDAEARRLQFEETLKNLMLSRGIKMQSGDNVRKRHTRQIQGRDITVPPQFREAYEAYNRSFSTPTGK